MAVGAVRPERAMRQHEAFLRAIEEAGGAVVRVPFVHGAYDSVFAKDNAIVVRRPETGAIDVLLGRPKFAERRLEQRERGRALVRHVVASGVGGNLHRVTAPLEGGDVVMMPNSDVLLGHGFRSSRHAAANVAAFLGPQHRVVPIELRDPRLYHLDMAVAVLRDGTALVCEEAITPASKAVLAAHPAIRAWIRVPLGEALSFGVNLVEIHDVVLHGAADRAHTTRRAIEKRGYEVRFVELDQFHLAGGSAACLVSRIHSLPVTEVERAQEDEAADEPMPQSTAA